MDSAMESGWALMIGAALTWFAIQETIAIRAGRNDLTLSGVLRKWLGIEPERPWGKAAGVAFLLGLAVLGSHIVAGWP